MASLVTIGDFSRASHLTVKTLRHYHDAGLLEPSDIDPQTGYRYYSTDQLPVAQVIRRLRNLRMPVADVKAVLAAADADARNRLIADHLDRLESELAETRAAVSELRDLLQPPAPHPIEHRTVPPTPAIAIEDTVDRDDLYAWWQGAIGELTATARAQGLHQTGPVGGLYADELFHDGRGPATVYLPCEGTIKPIGRVVATTIPQAELAVARHDGSPRDIDRTYGELAAHVVRHEIGVAGPLREHYLRGIAETADAAEWQTEIGWPIFRTHA
ncbi:MerR family transcriptional regulator [Solirubrobacter sp. CPCC 204708]|uniref:MerR family transcriptional regulator n=1 Tax=Solirubrobacter deserti TaxID=2282478 RepID=A0ABT4RQ40_9ACTN|nr:MerR family transcriptional regulator [Solirubrobacter deserti]MBE2320615.1 MerR family transcriptional regulator [Solirubrobacter deserti]MDA0140669.1 MerR family transcriptional regulator [Solirubrobacter deserti]